MDVTNAADTLTLAGPISGAGSVAKDGAGVLRLTGTNTYGGTTEIMKEIIARMLPTPQA